MNSRIYKGWVEHRRSAPQPHRFRYRLFMMYLDLAELPQLFDRMPLWSARRPALAWFRRGDYLGPPHLPLDRAVRDLVACKTGSRPGGPIRLLTHLRYFGKCTNPVSFYFCFNTEGTGVETLVAEITNTPWGERHQYVLRVPPDGRLKAAEFAKDFHVSPFMPMDLRYRWRFTEPARHWCMNMQNWRGGECMFAATLALREAPLNRASLLGALVCYLFMTLRVLLSIYWQALKLYCKRIPVFAHPRGIAP